MVSLLFTLEIFYRMNTRKMSQVHSRYPRSVCGVNEKAKELGLEGCLVFDKPAGECW